jgi:hypothetical protein
LRANAATNAVDYQADIAKVLESLGHQLALHDARVKLTNSTPPV